MLPIFKTEELNSYINYLEFFSMGDLSILHYSLASWLISLHQYKFMDIYFILWVIIQYHFTYFLAQILPALVIDNCFECPL